MKNWARNVTYSTSETIAPNAGEVKAVLARADKVRPLGSKHSFSKIADSDQLLLSTASLNRLQEIDMEAKEAVVGAGTRYGDICLQLDKAGASLQNLASLPHISIGGACATATHGSGVGNSCLATAVKGFEIVDGSGQSHLMGINDEKFFGCLVGLGATGVITNIKLELLEAQPMQQVVFRNLPNSDLYQHFIEVLSCGYSVSLFTDWQKGLMNQVWVKGFDEQIKALPNELQGAYRAYRKMHPIDDHPAENCTDQLGIPGPWYERLPHFKMKFTPSSGEELQSEYFVALEDGPAAMQAMEKLGSLIFPHLYISEIRTIAADGFWMSPFYNKDCLAFHFTWKPHLNEVLALLPEIEAALHKFNVRPHWGKLHTIPPNILRRRIDRFSDFKKLANELDPNKKLVNKYLYELMEG